MNRTPEPIEITQARHEAHMRQLRAEFEKLWVEKKPILIGAYPRPLEVELMRSAHLCWLAFKEGRRPQPRTIERGQSMNLTEATERLDARDEFAKMAMPEFIRILNRSTSLRTITDDNAKEIAELSYRIADAMMVARKLHEPHRPEPTS